MTLTLRDGIEVDLSPPKVPAGWLSPKDRVYEVRLYGDLIGTVQSMHSQGPRGLRKHWRAGPAGRVVTTRLRAVERLVDRELGARRTERGR